MRDGEPFVSGVATYFDEDPSFESKQASVHVNVLLRGDECIDIMARLDPATPWVILNAEINEKIGLQESEQKVMLHTLQGRMSGSLERFPVTLKAEEGRALEVEATLFVCNDWIRGNFLGYSGLLQRIRFAIDPDQKKFYFGPCD